jgi:hypothetical protein
MNRLSKEERTKIIAALVEGNSLRATARMCGVAFNTVLKLPPDIGRACAEYQDKALRNLKCKRIQCDEPTHIVSFRRSGGGGRRLIELHFTPSRRGPRRFARAVKLQDKQTR